MISLSWKNIESTDAIVKINKLLKFMSANGTFTNSGEYDDGSGNRSNFVSGFSESYEIPLEVIERRGRTNLLRELDNITRNIITDADTQLNSMDYSFIHSINKLLPIDNLREHDNRYAVMIMINFERVPEIMYDIEESGISDLPPNFSEEDMIDIDVFSNSIDETLGYIHNEFTDKLNQAVADVVTSSLKFEKE